MSQEQAFASFVIGKNNALAFDLCVYVARYPKGDLNPLFILGPGDFGKTHLLNAIQNEIGIVQPNLKVSRLESGLYFENFVSNYRAHRDPRQHIHLHLNSDLVLIDGVETFLRSSSSQYELAYILGQFLERKCQIVVVGRPPTGKQPSKTIFLCDELLAVLKNGFMASLKRPGITERTALSQHFLNQRGLRLSQRKIRDIARHSQGSVRKLYGDLITITRREESGR